MGTLLIIILESAACLALFYLLYKLILSKDTFHRFNRVVLLCMLLLSVVIPIVAILLEKVFQPPLEYTAIVTDVPMVSLIPIQVTSPPFPWTIALIVSVYAVGLLFFLGRLLRNWWVLNSLLRKCSSEKLEGRIKLYTHQLPIAPFSWMSAVVVSAKDLADNKDIILTHELAHIRLGHSWDLLVADLCILIQWFNPAAWLLRQEMKAVHEFEADDKVLRNGIDAKKYQLLIIEKAVGTRLYSMANSLNHGSLKKRITMMLKEKSSPWARAKYAVVLPLAAIALLGFAQPEFTTLQARSAGEIDQLLSWTEASAPTVPSENPNTSQSFSQSPNVNQSPQDKSSGNSQQSVTTDEKKVEDSKPLIVLDGVIIQPSAVSNLNFKTAMQDEYAKALNIDPADIKEITVLKRAAAIVAYGEIGQNGVLIITTKAKEQSVPAIPNLQVNGQVVDVADNTPVGDANIVEKAADGRILTATKSGPDGRFNLIAKRSDNLLVVSHISYGSFKVPIQKEMTVTLTKKKNMLDETVVKGFQKVETIPSSEVSKKESEMMVEKMPEFPGGQAALMKYIQTSMKYPVAAIEKNAQGKVVCSFVINATGRVTDVKVIQSIDPALDAEAVRVVSAMPNWIPGRQNGVDCAVQYAIPVVFSLEQYTVTAKKK